MPTPQLDPFQQVFALSMLSNRASAFTGSASALQQQLQYELGSYLTNTNLNTVSQGGFIPNTDPVPTVMPNIPGYMGNWSLEWGPVVFSHTKKNGKPSGVADNAMFVASCPSVTFPGCLNTNSNNQPTGTLTTYVVAIAATNPTSSYDWDVEDFEVSKAVLWEGWTPGNLQTADPLGRAAISLGTAIGVSNLLSLTPPATAPGAGQTLTDFLVNQAPGPNSAVIFTGHSLAGALAPTTAFYLQNATVKNAQQQSVKALSPFAYQMVYATAGATPGNVAFASGFNSAFPSPPQDPVTKAQWIFTPTAPYQCWNTLLWNTLDVVPHAWGLDLSFLPQSPILAQIPTIYGAPPVPGIPTLVDAAQANSGMSGAFYVHTRNQPLTGTLQPGIAQGENFFPTPTPPTTIPEFIGQVYVQHIGMYSGIPANPPHIPQCNGLILEQPVPRPPSPLPALPGVTTHAQDIDALVKKIETIVTNWLKKHHLA